MLETKIGWLVIAVYVVLVASSGKDEWKQIEHNIKFLVQIHK